MALIPSWRAISVLYIAVVAVRTVHSARRRAFALGVAEGIRTSGALGGSE